MKGPKISIVLPAYNAAPYLRAAVDSILQQTFTDFELIIINDGSSDETSSILNELLKQDDRLIVIERENRGFVASLNEAISHSSSDLIARMDADDVSLPDRLAQQHAFMQSHPNAVVVGSAAHFVDREGNRVCTYLPPTTDEILRSRFPDSPFIHPTVMFRKQVCLDIGMYPEEMRWGGEDVVFFARMAKLGTLHNLDIPLLNYRLVPGSMSRKPPEFRQVLVEIIKKEIAGEPIHADEFLALQCAYQKIGKAGPEFDYLFELAKLCVWSGNGRTIAPSYLAQAQRLKPYNFRVLFMRLLAGLPGSWVRQLYGKLKGRRFV